MALQIYSGDEAKRRNQRSADLRQHLRGQSFESYDRMQVAMSIVCLSIAGMMFATLLAYAFGGCQ